ncbi:Uncharacterized protein cmbei_8001763, partial [Cryptosporidium meleagridis]
LCLKYWYLISNALIILLLLLLSLITTIYSLSYSLFF